jgi:ornithine cyclodeaminase/alanine dehydrogenase-like protein (mu-crystallin family)
MGNNLLDRRTFIRGASATVALAAMSAEGLAAPVSAPAKRVALIGTGWYGKSDLFRLMQVAPVEVVALCDVDLHQLETAASMVNARQKGMKAPKLYRDYRKLLAEAKPEIVLIGTPDHWHALQTIDSVKAGAHVYVQKTDQRGCHRGRIDGGSSSKIQ